MTRRRITTTVTDLDDERPRGRKRGDDPLRRLALLALVGLFLYGASHSQACQQHPRPVYIQPR